MIGRRTNSTQHSIITNPAVFGIAVINSEHEMLVVLHPQYAGFVASEWIGPKAPESVGPKMTAQSSKRKDSPVLISANTVGEQMSAKLPHNRSRRRVSRRLCAYPPILQSATLESYSIRVTLLANFTHFNRYSARRSDTASVSDMWTSLCSTTYMCCCPAILPT